jgi:hypothetical protein
MIRGLTREQMLQSQSHAVLIFSRLSSVCIIYSAAVAVAVVHIRPFRHRSVWILLIKGILDRKNLPLPATDGIV